MTISAGGLNKKNIIIIISCLLLSIGLTLVLTGIGILATKKNNDEIRVENWQYVWVNEPESYNNMVSNWEHTGTGEIKKSSSNYKYLHLRTEIRSGSTKVLRIRSNNNLMNADVDGIRVLEQLGNGDLYSGASQVEIMLEPSEQTRTVDIYLYIPSVLRFSATIRDTVSVTLRDIMGILFGALILGASIVLLILCKKSNKELILIGFSCLILGICAILGQSGIYIRQLSSPFYYKIFVVLLMLTTVGMQYVSLKVLEAQKKMSWILYISAFFPVSFLISPYNAITQFILELYGVWCAAYVFVYVGALIAYGIPPRTGERALIAAFTTEAVVKSFYWLSYLIPFKLFYLQPYLLAVGVCIIIAAAVCLRSDTVESYKIAVTEDAEYFYKRIENLLLEKADTNRGHLENVAGYVKIMCRQMKMPEGTVNMVSNAALLHDIGKIAVPKSILKNGETINKDEFEQLRCHVLHGYNILIDPNDVFLQTAANIAKYHHERYDGTGYLGIKGNDIDLFSRITSIADTFDALTSYRTYKKAWSFDDAYEYINVHAGDYFDPELVKIFNSCRKEIREVYQKTNHVS
jgi:HD-GYP domain-containing protein (c-di-GMP phosphodiesterase class II)